jgi:DNA (cytosine-5)-methyltransferase 1
MTNAESKKIQPIRNNEESSKHPLEHLVRRHGSLFSGIGGFDLAAQWIGWENVFQVEIDEFAQKVLEKNFPNAKRYRDIREFDGTQYRGNIGILSGGFPCQPFSMAGQRKGEKDNRFLWGEMLRVIRETQPQFIVGENVNGITNLDNGRTLEKILLSLEDEGYFSEIFRIPACAIGAWHKRERIWICAHAKSFRWSIQRKDEIRDTQETFTNRRYKFESLDGDHIGQLSNCGTLRIDNGIPNRVDRIKALGNAIVPQVVFEIFKAIEAVSA